MSFHKLTPKKILYICTNIVRNHINVAVGDITTVLYRFVKPMFMDHHSLSIVDGDESVIEYGAQNRVLCYFKGIPVNKGSIYHTIVFSHRICELLNHHNSSIQLILKELPRICHISSINNDFFAVGLIAVNRKLLTNQEQIGITVVNSKTYWIHNTIDSIPNAENDQEPLQYQWNTTKGVVINVIHKNNQFKVYFMMNNQQIYNFILNINKYHYFFQLNSTRCDCERNKKGIGFDIQINKFEDNQKVTF